MEKINKVGWIGIGRMGLPMVKKILEAGLTRLRFSLDAATKETFEKIRIGADYESVMKNIERFVELRNKGGYKLPVIGVNFVKMKTRKILPFFWLLQFILSLQLSFR